MDSLYDVLGVSSRANETAIRTAFRKAAKSYHPDLNAGNPTAELQFRQIVAAYELLKDPLQREAYDQQLKDDRRARTRRIASPLISGVVSGGLVALTMDVGALRAPNMVVDVDAMIPPARRRICRI